MYKEVISVFGDKTSPTFNDLASLKYTLAVFYESLRMYPIITAIPKINPQDTVIGDGMFIPANTVVCLHTCGVHYNPKYWKDPYEFRPERFMGDYNKDAFIPFSEGARGCIGRKVTQVEAVSIMAMISRAYTIEVPEGVDKKTMMDATIVLTLVPITPIKLKFVARNNEL
jgi:cytochrome P450